MKRLSIIIFLLLVFCSGNKQSNPPVAKVANSVLTLEMINDVFDADNSQIIGFDEKRDYAERWVERELLYKEAVKRGLKEDPFIKRELSNLQMELAIDRLLELEIERKLEITDDEIKDYYENNSQYFQFLENNYKYERIMVKSLKDSRIVEKELKAKRTFTEISKKVKNVLFVNINTINIYIKESQIPAELLKTISAMKVGAWGGNKLKDGYHFLRLTDKRNKGDVMDLNLVKNEIISKIIAQKRKEKYNQLINSLRDNADVEINYSELGFLGEEGLPDTLESRQNK